MSAPRFVSPLRWEPAPYLALVVLLVLTGIVRPESGVGYLVLVAAIVLAGVWLVIGILRERRTKNPDLMGDLADAGALDLVDAPAVPGAHRTAVPVADAHRHQASIDLARLQGGAQQHAVLVPRARRWLSPRYRIGVQLVGGGTPHHAGFLPDDADARWRDRLDRLRAEGRFVRVPVTIEGVSRPLRVELNVSGLGAALGLADERPD